MTVIVLDGPEAAGKTSIIYVLKQTLELQTGLPVTVRKWGALDDGKWAVDRVYRDALVEDHNSPNVSLWDRSWASEAVYARLLGRDRRLGTDPWLGEWLYGRGVPLKYILAGPDPSVLEGRRKARLAAGPSDDLPTDPAEEQAAFYWYGTRYGWTTFGPWLVQPPTVVIAHRIIEDYHRLASAEDPRSGCGPADARVVFVGERSSQFDSLVGGWLPFSSTLTSKYGRLLGDDAMRCAWTNAWDDRRDLLEKARLVVACGMTAYQWVGIAYEERRFENSSLSQLMVPHPAALYRWGRYKDRIEEVETLIQDRVRAALFEPAKVG